MKRVSWMGLALVIALGAAAWLTVGQTESTAAEVRTVAMCVSCRGTGSGPFQCAMCKGTGKSNGFRCNTCYGKGFSKCVSCNGTGQK